MPFDDRDIVREIDPRGRIVRLTSDQWHSHILPRHPDIAKHLWEIPRVIREPNLVRRDALQRHRECYYRHHIRPTGRPIFLKAVVDFQTQADMVGFLVTCFLTTRLKPGEEDVWLPSI